MKSIKNLLIVAATGLAVFSLSSCVSARADKGCCAKVGQCCHDSGSSCCKG